MTPEEALRRTMHALPDAVHQGALEALREIGEQMAADTARLAPRQTGRLANSYRATTGVDPNGQPYVEVGTPVEYAPYIEFGRKNAAPRPHLRPAADLARATAAQVLARRIADAQRAAVRRLPRRIIVSE